MGDKLNLGCGNIIMQGYVNLDSAKLPGVDVVHDLRQRPWPLADNRFEEIQIHHVLEHLPDTIAVMEELWRICAPGCQVILRVPYWNAEDFITDPTHIKAFNEHTFEFFDPDDARCKERPYYSRARFKIRGRTYVFKICNRYYYLRNPLILRLMERVARFFCNIIQVMEFRLEAVK